MLGKASESTPTLVDLLDIPKIPKIELRQSTFVDSAFSIEGILASALAVEEIKGAIPLAKRLRVLVGTLREGKHAILKESTSIREFLQEYATKWSVGILIQGDIIMIVDANDVNRFEHKVAILP